MPDPRPLILESTRSHAGEDAWRDMDGFDRNEELARLRRAVDEVQKHYLAQPRQRFMSWVLNRWTPTKENVERFCNLFAFISEAFSNLDESLVRLGPLPRAWFASADLHVVLKHVAEQLAEDLEAMLSDVDENSSDEYRRGQKRGYLDAAVLLRRAFQLPDRTDPSNPHA